MQAHSTVAVTDFAVSVRSLPRLEAVPYFLSTPIKKLSTWWASNADPRAFKYI